MIQKGSKSFSLAARLFEPATRDAAFFLYGWCRYCDDQVDQVGASVDQRELAARLQALKDNTAAAFSLTPQQEPVFIALQYIVHRYGIPSHYALELIEGMAMDVRATQYASLKELLLYCYRVAGTVGLMMAHVMGLRDEAALKHAADLGIAMQLTNIARDIVEDASMGRIYLPSPWLARRKSRRQRSPRRKIARNWRCSRSVCCARPSATIARATRACGIFRFVRLAPWRRRAMFTRRSALGCCKRAPGRGMSGPTSPARARFASCCGEFCVCCDQCRRAYLNPGLPRRCG